MKTNLRIDKPCPLVEELLATGESKPFCQQCQHVVWRLAALSKKEVRVLEKRVKNGERVCVALPGSLVARKRVPRWRIWWSAIVPLGLSQCATKNLSEPVESAEQSVPMLGTAQVEPEGKSPGKDISTGGIPAYNPTLWQRVKDFFVR